MKSRKCAVSEVRLHIRIDAMQFEINEWLQRVQVDLRVVVKLTENTPNSKMDCRLNASLCLQLERNSKDLSTFRFHHL